MSKKEGGGGKKGAEEHRTGEGLNWGEEGGPQRWDGVTWPSHTCTKMSQ